MCKRSCQRAHHNFSTLFDELLERRLLVYAVAAGATILAAPVAQGEVLFTPSNAILSGSSGKLAIDLDHDGLIDFTLVIKDVKSFSGYQTVHGLGAYGNRPSHQLGADRFGEAIALKPGTRVAAGQRFQASAIMVSGFGYLGNWSDAKNEFLGLRFLLNGEVHYAWIGFRSVTGRVGSVAAQLEGWAYETTPDAPIVAGDTATGFNAELAQPTSLELLASGHADLEQRRKRSSTARGQ
jgi:hypothetical protein